MTSQFRFTLDKVGFTRGGIGDVFVEKLPDLVGICPPIRWSRDKKGLLDFHQEGHIIPGNDLLSHLVTKAVPSAQEGLTTLFGMGRGVTPPPKSPEFFKFIK